MAKGKEYKDFKIEKETAIKLLKAKNLAEFKNEETITISEFVEELLEPYFKKFDNLKIERIKE